MANRLDSLLTEREISNTEFARTVGCSTNYVSGIRNGMVPSIKLATAMCRQFPGELTLRDLGIDVDPVAAGGEAKNDAA